MPSSSPPLEIRVRNRRRGHLELSKVIPGDARFRIIDTGGWYEVYIDLAPAEFPIGLELIAADPLSQMEAVGFAEAEQPEEPTPHTAIGPAGGCFALETELGSPKDRVRIEDSPNQERDFVNGFELGLWFVDAADTSVPRSTARDPRIYNHGGGGLLRRWWRALVRLLSAVLGRR